MNIKNIKLPTFWENYEYFVNEEKKIVVAKERYFCSDFYRKLEGLGLNSAIEKFILAEWINFCKEKNCFSVTAKATCASDDKFEPIIGTEIARLRLEEKTQKLYMQFFVNLERQFYNFSMLAEFTADKAIDKWNFLGNKLSDFLEEGVEE